MPARRTQSARKVRRYAGADGAVRVLPFKASSYDPQTREFVATLCTETECNAVRNGKPVAEVLPMAGLVGLDGFIGAPLLDTHRSNTWRDQVGDVVDAWIEEDRLMFRGRLDSRPDVDDLAGSIERGIIKTFSVGADIEVDGVVKARNGKKPLVVVKRWRPFEASIASDPADLNARIRSRSRNVTNRSGDRRRVGAANTLSTRSRSKRMADITVETEDQIWDHVVEILEDVLADVVEDDAVDIDIETIEEIADEVVDAVVEDVAAEGGEGEDSERSRKRRRSRRSSRSSRSSRRSTRTNRSERSSKGDDTKIRSLRAVAKRNGTAADFRDLEASGASMTELRQVAIASVRTSGAEINGERTTRSGRGTNGLVGFDETPAGKRAARRNK